MRASFSLSVFGVAAALLLHLGCGDDAGSSGGAGGDAAGGGGAGGEAGDPLGPWSARPIELAELTAVWGGLTAQESPTRAYLAGGLTRTGGTASTKVLRVEQVGSNVTVTTLSEGLADRYCGCAMVDPTRGELIVLGGRDGSFQETPTAELVALGSGAVSAIDPAGAADHPVGCHAVFLPERDEGYVFGGYAQSGGFSNKVHRYSPSDRSFTELSIAGALPPARYDGAFRHPKPGGPVYLVGGMGLAGGVKFYPDVWTFDPASESWAEIAVAGELPPGRRLPWVAFAGDDSALVMGFGSDSPQGQTLLGDLWRLDLASKTWSRPGYTGAAPGLRGFAQWLPGPEGTAGLLSGGLGETGMVNEQLVLEPPTASGGWR